MYCTTCEMHSMVLTMNMRGESWHECWKCGYSTRPFPEKPVYDIRELVSDVVVNSEHLRDSSGGGTA